MPIISLGYNRFLFPSAKFYYVGKAHTTNKSYCDMLFLVGTWSFMDTLKDLFLTLFSILNCNHLEISAFLFLSLMFGCFFEYLHFWIIWRVFPKCNLVFLGFFFDVLNMWFKRLPLSSSQVGGRITVQWTCCSPRTHFKHPPRTNLNKTLMSTMGFELRAYCQTANRIPLHIALKHIFLGNFKDKKNLIIESWWVSSMINFH